MNREQSIQLFNKCEAARKEALDAGKGQDEAHEAAKTIWNAWANQLLKEKKQFENDGTWEGNKDSWENKAVVTFTQCDFQIVKSEKITLGENKNIENQEKAQTIFCKGNIINLSDYIFPDITFFDSATFSDDVLFGSTTFTGDAVFDSTTFTGAAVFKTSVFTVNTFFKGTTFTGDAVFDSTTFTGDAVFNSTTFTGNVGFRASVFTGNTFFKSAKFAGDSIFWGARFSGYVNFDSTIFSVNTTFQNSDFEASSQFNNSHFELDANFTALHSKRAFDLSDIKFKKVPNFHQADFTQAPNLANVEVPIISFWKSIFGKLDKEEIPKFRALRRLAIEAHDHERERYFFKGEMRYKRGTEEKWWQFWKPNWWFSLLYDMISDYGVAVLRPLGLWLAMIPLFGWVYTSLAQKCDCENAFYEGMFLAYQNNLIFFSINRRLEISKAYNCLYNTDSLPTSLGYIGSFNSLISAFLLFMILLGLRNMFKISS